MFDHDAGGDDELSLREGELVEVLNQLEDAGWWIGLLNGKIGLFPSSYVKLGKSTISFPKSQSTSVPITPAKEEPGDDEDDEDDSRYHYGEDLYPPVMINQEPGELKFKIMRIVHTELHIKEVSGYLCCLLVK